MDVKNKIKSIMHVSREKDHSWKFSFGINIKQIFNYKVKLFSASNNRQGLSSNLLKEFQLKKKIFQLFI